MSAVRIGTAGWSIPRAWSQELPGNGSHLERYAKVFSCAEINSTFYRPSRESTWLRWAASVPDDFRFSVKAPRFVSHDQALALTPECMSTLHAFLVQARLLGDKLGPLLFQLPPKEPFAVDRATAFFSYLRTIHDSGVVLEPRHPSWFSPEAEALLCSLRIARVAADPAPVPDAAKPAGSHSPIYYRLHGSPRKYYSAYTAAALGQLSAELDQRAPDTEAWVIFDNTASGAALGNALALRQLTSAPSG